MGTHNYEVVIVGAGPAGMTAGLYAGRSMLKTVVLERGAPGGELLNTEMIEDYPGFEHVEGWDLAQKFASHAAKFGCEFHTRNVESVKRLDDGTFETRADDGEVYHSPTVIVTAGGTPIKLNIPGENEYAGKGVSYCAVCDGAFFKGHTIAVVGGGDAACEEADYLTRFATKVYLIHRRDSFRAEAIMVDKLMEKVAAGKIELKLHSTLDEVLGDATGVTGVRIRRTTDGGTEDLALKGCFIAIGHQPNTDIFKGQLEMKDGYIVTKTGLEGMATMTSVPGVFAAGDVQDHVYRQAITSAGTGCMAALDAQRFLEQQEA